MTSAPPRASQTAAWPAELPPPTTATREPAQSWASGAPGGVEDRQSLELGKAVDRQPPVLSTRREQDGARGDLPVVLEADEMTAVPRFEGEGAVRGRGARVELARLGDRAARELGAADAGGEAEVVLDPTRRPGLAAERGALDDERVEPFGGAVDRGREACRAGADDQQVDLLARRELEPDPESAQHLAGARTVQLSSAGQPHERQRAALRAEPSHPRCTAAGSRARTRASASSARSRAGRRSRGRFPRTLCNASRRAMKVERRRSLSGPSSLSSERNAPRSTAMYRSGSVTSALTKTVCPDRRFSSPRKPEGAVPDQLVPGGVDDRDLSFEDRDERVRPIADPVQQLTDRRRALFADLGESS